MKNAKPNVLLVGSAKAGTTALFSFLCEHPSVEIPSRKEPKFFSYIAEINQLSGPGDNMTIERCVKKEQEYFNLYSSDQNIISIDGSVDNLYYHKEVIPLIKEKLGDVQIVISLRNPITRAFSAYAMQIRDQRETLPFEEALEIEDYRIKQAYEFIWHYKNCGLYYHQVKAYMDNFTNVKVVIIDDFKEDPKSVFEDVLSFLNLDPKYEIDLSRSPNKTGIPKSGILHKVLVLSNPVKKISTLMPVGLRRFIHEKVIKKLIGYTTLKYAGECSRELVDFFEKDVKKLSELLDRDLTKLWLDQYKKEAH
jgi:hypothetical protein